jgi:SAM-dependent methyltransferase
VKSTIRRWIRSVLPRRVLDRAKAVVSAVHRFPELRRAARAFSRAAEGPRRLDGSMLEVLQRRYPPPPEYGYDPGTLMRRGQERARQILGLRGVGESAGFLEFGCWDGMVAGCLARRGGTATAIDVRSEGFDPRATEAGARLLRMDAARMGFDDESFDVVYSYDALEHVTSPEVVLREAIRVLRPGGAMFLEFGPLYRSAFGEHAYGSVTVPYCQFLFEPADLDDFTQRHGLEPIDFQHVNGWSLAQYRRLWRTLAPDLAVVRYDEIRNLSHLDIIRAHPSCFRRVTGDLEEFLVAVIRVHFTKRRKTSPR